MFFFFFFNKHADELRNVAENSKVKAIILHFANINWNFP